MLLPREMDFELWARLPSEVVAVSAARRVEMIADGWGSGHVFHRTDDR
jgi:hypothetical protein